MGQSKKILICLTAVLGAAPLLAAYAQQASDASVGIHKAQIYPSVEQAGADVQAALAKARHDGKRVILDFGGDWCPDCQVLNIYFQKSPNAELLAQYFIRVNINVGHLDANKEIAEHYGVPLKGVPALAVLDGDGKVIYAQSKEFSDMRHLDAASLTEFLNRWKH